MTLNLEVPKVFKPLWQSKDRYKGAKGGRGSGKSWAVADNRLIYQVNNPNSSGVCLREVQKSIKYSSKKLLEDKIKSMGLQDFFIILQNEIRMKHGDGVIIFNGLQDHTADSIKSLEGFDWAWVEEAQSITKHSLDLLIPTIRKDGSELYFTWNSRGADDPIELLFNNTEDKTLIHADYDTNPFCPKSIKKEAEQMRKVDYENYLHVYKGQYVTRSDAQIMKDKFSVIDFEIDEKVEKYYGLDFGFSNDPTAATASYIKDNCLYIYSESGGVGIEVIDTHLVLDKIINSKRDLVYGDSARPEIISHLKNQGYNVVSVPKWKGSVEDGISTIRSFKHVYIHASCTNTANEFVKYSYKVDKAGNITSNIIDDFNHYIDSLRYGLTPIIKSIKENNVSEEEIEVW